MIKYDFCLIEIAMIILNQLCLLKLSELKLHHILMLHSILQTGVSTYLGGKIVLSSNIVLKAQKSSHQCSSFQNTEWPCTTNLLLWRCVSYRTYYWFLSNPIYLFTYPFNYKKHNRN